MDIYKVREDLRARTVTLKKRYPYSKGRDQKMKKLIKIVIVATVASSCGTALDAKKTAKGTDSSATTLQSPEYAFASDENVTAPFSADLRLLYPDYAALNDNAIVKVTDAALQFKSNGEDKTAACFYIDIDNIIRCKDDVTAKGLEIRTHEITHMIQSQKTEDYEQKYADESAKYGYSGNQFEIEAYVAACQVDKASRLIDFSGVNKVKAAFWFIKGSEGSYLDRVHHVSNLSESDVRQLIFDKCVQEQQSQTSRDVSDLQLEPID